MTPTLPVQLSNIAYIIHVFVLSFPQVQPKAPLLQILRVAGAQEEVFTLKEVSCQVKK